MTIWFTSDTHFGHENIIKYSNRPFSTVEEMDEVLIENWNNFVSVRDTVYHLGDFCFKDAKGYLKKLHGKKKILIGSHDAPLLRIGESLGWESLGRVFVYETPIVRSGHRIRITLSHYAMRSWPLSHYGHWHLYGHHHGQLEPYGLSFDVGVDSWGYRPISFDEVYVKMKTLKPIVDYSEER